MNEKLVIETLTLIGAAALSIALVARVGLPAVLGYLFAGIVIGPLGFGLVAAKPVSENSIFRNAVQHAV